MTQLPIEDHAVAGAELPLAVEAEGLLHGGAVGSLGDYTAFYKAMASIPASAVDQRGRGASNRGHHHLLSHQSTTTLPPPKPPIRLHPLMIQASWGARAKEARNTSPLFIGS